MYYWLDYLCYKQSSVDGLLRFLADRSTALSNLPASTLWLTGLPCAGKSTLAGAIAGELQRRARECEILDADVIRRTICRGLGYTRGDRDENVARLGWICALLNRHRVTAIVAAVSPYREARDLLRTTIPNFVEIYVKAPLQVCLDRDVKGMYRKAMAGEIPKFTGISDPYEEPLHPEMTLETAPSSVEECTDTVIQWLEQKGWLEMRPRYDKVRPGLAV